MITPNVYLNEKWSYCSKRKNICAFLFQSSTLKNRNGADWRAYCNLKDMGQSVYLITSHCKHAVTSRAKIHVIITALLLASACA